MREPGAILLVACYELGHQPLAVAWPAAFLEREGYAPAVMDVSVEPFDPERVRRAKVVAISVPMHTALRLGVTVARRVRDVSPTCHIVFYGLYAALPSLKKYAHLERNDGLELVGYVEASRGCKHLCRHCPIPPVYGGRFFVVPVEVLLADIRQQVEAGATHITFGDPDFLNGPGHALAVARALHEAFPALTFDFTAKIEHLLRHRERLPELAQLGCAFVVSAAESLNDTILAHLDKGHTRADIETAVRLTAEAGIALRPTWVAFTPWTALEDYRQLLNFVEAHGLIDAIDPVQYSIRLLVPPGSLLLESAALRPFLGELVEDQFYHRWRHPDPRMEALHAEVSSVVAAAADQREDAAVTFQRVRELADGKAGVAPRPLAAPAVGRKRAPRLTEPWFC